MQYIKHHVRFIPPSTSQSSSRHKEYVDGVTQAYKKIGMSNSQITEILKGRVDIIECTSEQFTIFLIERAKLVPTNRFRELDAVLLPAQAVIDPYVIDVSRCS